MSKYVDATFLDRLIKRYSSDIPSGYSWWFDVVARKAKRIVFSHAQAEVFIDLAAKYSESLEYRLPYMHTWLQFDHPVRVRARDASVSLVGMLLEQFEEDSTIVEDYEFSRQHEHLPDAELDALIMERTPAWVTRESADEINNAFQNSLCWVSSDGSMGRWHWGQKGTEIAFLREDAITEAMRNLAIACIGYINCENIYLHREGDVPEAVNAKRERKGKTRLEPYYVCRIRGVNYDGPVAKGTGVEHGFRYDVRGHFRRLDTGKVTWVRPHQRGLKHELYIPKVYEVA